MDGTVFDSLVEILNQFVDLSEINIDENSILGEDIPIDSSEMLRFLSRIESRYGFQFEPKDILSMGTLRDIIDVIQRRINKKN